MTVDILDTPIEFLKGVGPKRAEIMRSEFGISTFYDLLTYYPFRYVDRSRFFSIGEINSDAAWVQLKGRVTGTQLAGKGVSMRYIVTVADETGSIDLVYFQGIKWVKDKFQSGTEYVIFGKPSLYNGRYNIPHPEVETAAEFYAQPADPLHPLYSTTEKSKLHGITSRAMAKLAKTLVLQVHGMIPETLTREIMDELKLIPRDEALANIHFPSDHTMLAKAEARIKFEELFFIQLRLLRYKLFRSRTVKGHRFAIIGKNFNTFYSQYLPFALTGAQKKVLKEIRADMGSGKQMNRLLQGDVGSGKTVVALMSMLIALDNGYQACLMAPTEILANQHFKTISKLLDGTGITCDLLTGSTRQKQRKEMFSLLRNGELHILIGTHALIEDTVQFSNLGLVVIDEQHRFGVAQRAKLWSKSADPPHILVMTATPIPRTLAMTLYGDLDFSVIDELPPGRKPIKTYHFFETGREKVYNFMLQQIKSGKQIYVVFPLIQESETLDMKNLEDGYQHIVEAFPPPAFRVSIVHGRMKPDEKDAEMQRFSKGDTNILVATTVIEVGVDIPNASVMVIESAERFGLSQLHQLRGRVGRGADQSHCILLTGYNLGPEARTRMETMVRTSNGFEIANVDLKLRGPGDLEGTRQSGVLDLKLADIIRDEAILRYARRVASNLLNEDPSLEQIKNRPLAEQLKYLSRKNADWSMIS
ncbi:MAG TPA: ATP-dependent DNA helicase RecG [Bacteroidales bacterium]|nr:ATP-dependent DNA helicase RecG [Bacteroidales bacterium]